MLNPAISFAILFTSWFYCGNDNCTDNSPFKWVWLYPVIPFAGAIVAVIFYELIFKKTQEVLNNDNVIAEKEEADEVDNNDDSTPMFDA